MKIRVLKSTLLSGISIVSKAVPNKTTMSILECIMIDATGSNIVLIANDMELGIQNTVEGEIDQNGKIAVNAANFSNIIRKLHENEVTIVTEGEKVTITCEKTKFAILGKEGEDFTYLPDVKRSDVVTMSQFSLKNIIQKTIFSVSGSEGKGLMTGELMEIKDGQMKMVALDGHRIAIREIALKDPSEEHQVVIAGKTLNEISKILSSDTEKEVHIYITEKHVVFEFDQTVVVSRLMEGKYYNIDSMLSSQYSTTVNMNRKELLDSIDRGMLLIKEDDKKPIIIMVSESSMKCKINTTIGSMDETIDIQKSGENINIGFNPKFLIDALRAIEDEEVTLYMVSPKAPCFIRSKEGAEEKYCYLILPVNFVTID